MQLRKYQQEALRAAVDALEQGLHPVLQLATGTGKSIIIAALAEHYKNESKTTWVLTHVQQLVKQNAAVYMRYTGHTPAIVCAGLQRKDTDAQGVVFGTIQSVRGALDEMQAPDLIIIDEAHRVPHNKGEPTLYESLLRRYPLARRVALTATPWRMDNGKIYGDGDAFWFDTVAYNYHVARAVADGWLCPLVGVETAFQLDLKGVGVSNGDFVQTDVDALQATEWLEAMAESLPALAGARKHVAVYCPTIMCAMRAASAITKATGWPAEVLVGIMSDAVRVGILRRFEAGTTRVLCSVDMITTGFDFPALDCIVCLRPTLSSSLWVQIQGRGTRPYAGKKNCLILDYVGNLQRLGGVDMYETYYREGINKAIETVAAVATKPYVKNERRPGIGVYGLKPIDPMTGEEAGEGATLTVDVNKVTCVAITTRRNPLHPVLLVQYTCLTPEGARLDASAFVSTENPSENSFRFFERRHLAVKLPSPARLLTWQLKGARQPAAVTVRKKGRYWNVLVEHYAEGAA